MNIYKKCKKFLLLKIIIPLRSIPFYLLRIFPIKNNKIIISNMGGRSFGDNGKYITLEMLAEKKDYDIVWITKDVSDISFPKEVRLVKYGSLIAVYELVTAKIWIDNARKAPNIRKRKRQYYINTGHGGIPLKKIEADAEESCGYYYINAAKHDSKMTDLLISNAKFRTNLFKNSYWYDGEILECGSPKIERLLLDNTEVIKTLKVKIGIPNDINIILYAPTFRNSKRLDIYDINFKLMRETIVETFGGEWIVLFRLHPNICDLSTQCSFTDVIDVTDYPDMQELLISADVLITDYSGTMFEKLYDHKKVLLYIPDYETYERGFYFNFDELPFPYAKTEQELLEIIRNWKQDRYIEEMDIFAEKIGLIREYGASKKIVERLEKIIH